MEVPSLASIVGPGRQELVDLELVSRQYLTFEVVLHPLVSLPLILQGLDNFVDSLVIDLLVVVPEPNLGFASLELFGRTVVDSMDP